MGCGQSQPVSYQPGMEAQPPRAEEKPGVQHDEVRPISPVKGKELEELNEYAVRKVQISNYLR